MNRNIKLLLEIFCLLTVSLALTRLLPLFEVKESENLSQENSEFLSTNSTREHSLLTFLPEYAWPGFTLLPESGSAMVKLLNFAGQTVHTWNLDADRARLLPNCNLLVVHGSKWGIDNEPWSSLREEVREYDWFGNVVWTYRPPDLAHHDVQRLENGNTLVLYRLMLPAEVKHKIYDESWRVSPVRADAIQEVRTDGSVVWNWNSFEHLDLNSCGRRGCNRYASDESSDSRRKDWTHINTIAPLPDNKHFQNGDLRFRPGNLLIVPRQWWQVLLIDRATGKPVWNYGGDYKGGIVRGHEAHMIEPGLPGAGNILIFDNGVDGERPYSLVLEIDPKTDQIIWSYDIGKKFYSRAAGSMQRLPNGNTLISEDVPGRLFEVTPEKKIVWKYKSPMRLSRAKRYAANYCPRFAELTLQ